MSFDPLSFPVQQYRGTPFNQTVAIDRPSVLSPRFVPLSFNWLVYFTANPTENIAVPINVVGGNNQGGLLDKIMGVKIDNTDSTISVSVYFPDTGDIVTCAPDTVTTSPVMTNGLRCVVIAQGLQAGFTPTTTVFLTNFFLPASTDQQIQTVFPQWLGSPTLQRQNLLTPGYGPPVLGDQTVFYEFQYPSPIAPQNFLQTPRASGKFYLQQITVMTASVSTPTVLSFAGLQLRGLAYGQLFNWRTGVQNTPVPSAIVYNGNAMNIPIPATDTWTISENPAGGAAYTGRWILQFNYSYVP